MVLYSVMSVCLCMYMHTLTVFCEHSYWLGAWTWFTPGNKCYDMESLWIWYTGIYVELFFTTYLMLSSSKPPIQLYKDSSKLTMMKIYSGVSGFFWECIVAWHEWFYELLLGRPGDGYFLDLSWICLAHNTALGIGGWYQYIVACQRGGVSNKPPRQRQDTGPGILWSVHRWTRPKRNEPHIWFAFFY